MLKNLFVLGEGGCRDNESWQEALGKRKRAKPIVLVAVG